MRFIAARGGPWRLSALILQFYGTLQGLRLLLLFFYIIDVIAEYRLPQFGYNLDLLLHFPLILVFLSRPLHRALFVMRAFELVQGAGADLAIALVPQGVFVHADRFFVLDFDEFVPGFGPGRWFDCVVGHDFGSAAELCECGKNVRKRNRAISE